ncbi:alpha/beta fold hydrolase [Rhodosalinus sp. K401]|uniref:alpha/beta fold hydrolase n=1 Tax=Rhodosalinus sp. K401 TaxID=3239195 RepID=UPI0035258716
MLATQLHGTAGDAPPVLIAHGLFGSGRNWGAIAKRLSDRGQVITVDMRNHGQSPWTERHDYPGMALDLAEVIEARGAPADVVGHSMGGKAAMVLALTRPALVRRLVVADIAPVPYHHSQAHNIAAMRAVDMSRVDRRTDAAEQLAPRLDDPRLVSFFTQALDVAGRRWRLNLDVLDRDMDLILGFPEDVTGRFEGPALFLSGGESDYVRPEHRDRIKALFPAARFARIPGAGHWLHAEKPREFEAAIRAFLDA